MQCSPVAPLRRSMALSWDASSSDWIRDEAWTYHEYMYTEINWEQLQFLFSIILVYIYVSMWVNYKTHCSQISRQGIQCHDSFLSHKALTVFTDFSLLWLTGQY